MKGPIPDAQIQDWSKATAFLGHNEVRAVKPLLHLSWRDRRDYILLRLDSNLYAQDRGVSDCQLILEDTAEPWGSPGELNHVAESNCPNEPAGQVG